jgi:hypothetical protein
MKERTKQPMGTPRQVRLPKDIETDLQHIADANDLDFLDVLRMAARTGLPVLKKRMGDTVKSIAA